MSPKLSRTAARIVAGHPDPTFAVNRAVGCAAMRCGYVGVAKLADERNVSSQDVGKMWLESFHCTAAAVYLHLPPAAPNAPQRWRRVNVNGRVDARRTQAPQVGHPSG